MELSQRYRLAGTSDRRVRVLFIPQWYPFNDPKRTAGSFCREHVHAAAIYDDVAVLAYTSRPQRWPTLDITQVDDLGVPTFCATYGRSFIPKTTAHVFSLNLKRAIRRVIEGWGWPEVIHTQDAYAYEVLKVAQGLKIPVVVSQHSGGFLRRELDQKAVKRYQWAFAQASSVLPANKFAEIDYAAYNINAKVSWLPNALDGSVFYPSSGGAREAALLHVSALTPLKRFPDVVRAFARVKADRPEAVLRIVGGRKYRAEMEALAASELPDGSFYFHGYLSRPDLADLMRSVRGLVLASEQETFSCVLMEAMACGCPVLTTKVGGIPAVVREGEGLFFEVGNIEQMAKGMSQLLDGTHGLDMDRISQETRRRFSHETVGRILHNTHLAAVDYSGAKRSATNHQGKSKIRYP